MNILLALRARLVGLDTRSTSDLLIPVDYTLGIPLNDLAEASNFANIMRVVDKTPYASAFQGRTIAEGDVSAVERVLSRDHARRCLNAFAGSPFKVGLALALLFLKNYELHDLFSVINGKANNLPSDRITECLIL
jgi:vacuolar-type H+-ATPase subunit C/Vma6